MIEIEKAEVWGFDHAIRGMRNPLNSWDRKDSEYFACSKHCERCDLSNKCAPMPNMQMCYVVGDNDIELMMKLARAGATHRKYLRQIFVSVDITAPLYWWKEFDTYKVGTVSNSCSTMHKIQAKQFSFEDFSCDKLSFTSCAILQITIDALNNARNDYLDTKDKAYWWQMIQLLPSSYNQKRTITMTYENLINILETRSNHKLDEWRKFCKWIDTLPLSGILKEGVSNEPS